MSTSTLPLIVVGSIGIDTIHTPDENREEILGGSASYACVAASFFTALGMVGVVGEDFPQAYTDIYKKFGIDTEGLQVKPGKTFRWAGRYEANMDHRETLSTDLNVFSDFSPDLPESYCAAPFLFLGNIGPELQMHVLDQIKNPKFVVMDTMNLWIDVAHTVLLEVIGRVTLLTLNESEARLLSEEHNLIKSGRALLAMGPEYVLIKKGEHGSLLFWKDGMFMLPAYPLDNVVDPTGAGDAFAGGFVGYLASSGKVTQDTLRAGMAYGSVIASFGCEDFSLDAITQLDRESIDKRYQEYMDMIRVG